LCEGKVPEMLVFEGRDIRCFYPDKAIATKLESRFVPAKTSDDTILDVESLKVHFPIRKGLLKRIVGYVRAVDDFSLSIKRGKTIALVGESGCGKTTAGKGILQLIPPTAGSVKFDGDELTTLDKASLRRRRSDMQIIFQDPASSMNPRMLVGDIIAEGMKAQNIGNKVTRPQRVAELLQKVGMPADAADRYPHEFSGGQRQRICIARALAVDPELIICDEPTSALDVSVQAQILNLLRDLQREFGLSYLFITHNISVVSFLADELVVMYLGRIVEQGETEAILSSPKHPYTKALLSAVPQIDQIHKQTVIKLNGDMPSPANPPSGCYFHPRCEYATDICLQQYPGRTEIEGKRWVNCHFPLSP
jgi:peptide/nickel transport system ATP-binding protein